MDLKFKVLDNKYKNIINVLKDGFKISSRLFIKLRDNGKIYLNRKKCKKQF